MGKKRITFYLDSNIHSKFKKLCEARGIIMSKKIQMLVESILKKEEKK